jgi:hypothetical protein
MKLVYAGLVEMRVLMTLIHEAPFCRQAMHSAHHFYDDAKL